jgi:Protein of unknown function (DUF4238)
MTVARRQHHVWRSYLEAWATDGKIFCLQSGQIFNPNVTKVAVERDFYKLHNLTDADIQAIRLIFGNSPTPAKEILENFIYMLGFAGRLKAELPSTGDPAIDAQLDRYIITAEEEFHARLESDIKPVFDAIRRKDLSFYDDPELCGQFAHFLSLQNLRTKGVRERFLVAERERPSGFGDGFSAERCWNIIAHCAAVNAGGSLLLERQKRPVILLENETGTPFITGDQPAVNLLGASPGEMPRLLAFYYPVSPQLAVILDEVQERTGFRPGQVSVEQVEILNGKIQRAAHKQVFGSSRQILEPFAQTS